MEKAEKLRNEVGGQRSDFPISRFQISAFALGSPLWSEDFTAKLFCNAEFWLERLPKLIGLCEITAIVIPSSGLDRFNPFTECHFSRTDPFYLFLFNLLQRLIEERPVTRTVLDQGESFNGWPAWAVPASFGEQVTETPLSAEIVAAGEERARELRLYAARLEVLDGRNLGRWE